MMQQHNEAESSITCLQGCMQKKVKLTQHSKILFNVDWTYVDLSMDK